MKKIYSLLLTVIITTLSLFAQAPQKMSYQAVIRDSENELVVNTEIGMQISILQGTADGTAVYVATHTPTTNANGLVSIEIGGDDATVTSGNFASIDWSAGPWFIKTETDPSRGTDYTITGTSQLLSVPYALHSGSSDVLTGEITESQISDLQNYLTEEADPMFDASPASGIEAADIANWDEAYSWGDHANEGYLTDYTETDPTVPQHVKDIETDYIANWNEAHGWGNHSDAGYIDSESDPTWSGSADITGDIGRTGNVGIGTTSPEKKLDVDGDVRANSFIGDGSQLTNTECVPSGVIVMWSGAIEDIPDGWALCDGTNGTPNLSDRFIMGTTSSPGATGGANSYTLSENQMPMHSHDFSGSTSSAGGHTHTIQGRSATVHPNTRGWKDMLAVEGHSVESGWSREVNFRDVEMWRTVSAGNHSHSFSGTTTLSGGNAPVDNRPAYYTLAFIIKL